MKTLVTGFGPFDVFSFNPSEKIAEHLSKRNNVDHRILPVEYGSSSADLLKHLEEFDPDVVLSFGLNGTIGHIAVEEIAVNLRASEVADNSGKIKDDEMISNDGPLALRSLLPVGKIVDVLRNSSIPARRSYSAGVYICNEVFYTSLEWAVENRRLAGFIHVPMATEMIAGDPRSYRIPHMSLEDLFKAGELILDSIVNEIR